MEEQGGRGRDEWYWQFGKLNVRGTAALWILLAEFLLTLVVLAGSGFLIVAHLDTAIDSAAVAVVSTVVGFWFGRAVGGRVGVKGQQQ